MKRWNSILLATPCLLAVLGTGPAEAGTHPRTPLPTSSPGYWLLTATGPRMRTTPRTWRTLRRTVRGTRLTTSRNQTAGMALERRSPR